ncbi:conserved hypothetical protein [Candidatus Nitrospira nitrosa]|uniref:Uncharacterized protein n=1 Tax=Candidatus Nitrospira nitrosa TaxID=1742972 RepID=A0A0S4L847_9BACT|nr:hypothetical protein [Candidatus Nitrospira nitrosa]CUS33873.1 conserved hypothetical protein [Candidatus Nitrospira nitrosa]
MLSLSGVPMEIIGKPNKVSALSDPTRHDICARCDGLMVVAHYVDLQGHAGGVMFKELRCTNCGEFIDQMVLANRLKPAPQALEGPKQRKFAR